MHESEKRLNALSYALGWLVIVSFVWVTVGWSVSVAWLNGGMKFLPGSEWVSGPLVVIFIGIAKLIAYLLLFAWIGVVLYRKRLRQQGG